MAKDKKEKVELTQQQKEDRKNFMIKGYIFLGVFALITIGASALFTFLK